MYILFLGDPANADYEKAVDELLDKGHQVIVNPDVRPRKDETNGEYFRKLVIRTDCVVNLGPLGLQDDTYQYLIDHQIPYYEYPNIPDMHPTEKRSPVQAAAFIEMVMDGYALHLIKNMDYSPANILATGELGLVTRLWDKVARLLSLSGFKISISGSEFTSPSQPKNESIDDTYMDLMNYGIIGRLLRAGKWGK